MTRGVWDYLHDAELARAYDARLAASPLPRIDVPFTERHFARPGRLLDLGCGTGRLIIPFAARGFWTLGVDLSEEMLRVAGERAAAAGVGRIGNPSHSGQIHRLKANLVDLACLDDGCFDYAACLFSTLGMVAGAEQRRRVVAHVWRLLRPGGRFVLHVHNRWSNLWRRQARWWLIRDWLRSWLAWKPAGDHTAPAHHGIPSITLHLFTRREAVKLLHGAGFRILKVTPLGGRPDGRLRCAWCLGRLRAVGYLIAAEKP